MEKSLLLDLIVDFLRVSGYESADHLAGELSRKPTGASQLDPEGSCLEVLLTQCTTPSMIEVLNASRTVDGGSGDPAAHHPDVSGEGDDVFHDADDGCKRQQPSSAEEGGNDGGDRDDLPEGPGGDDDGDIVTPTPVIEAAGGIAAPGRSAGGADSDPSMEWGAPVEPASLQGAAPGAAGGKGPSTTAATTAPKSSSAPTSSSSSSSSGAAGETGGGGKCLTPGPVDADEEDGWSDDSDCGYVQVFAESVDPWDPAAAGEEEDEFTAATSELDASIEIDRAVLDGMDTLALAEQGGDDEENPQDQDGAQGGTAEEQVAAAVEAAAATSATASAAGAAPTSADDKGKDGEGVEAKGGASAADGQSGATGEGAEAAAAGKTDDGASARATAATTTSSASSLSGEVHDVTDVQPTAVLGTHGAGPAIPSPPVVGPSAFESDDFYPVRDGNAIYDRMTLRVITQRYRTGFEPTKELPIRPNSIIAGRYQVLEYLGSAAFSRAVQALDLGTGQLVCLKVIKNNKDFIDQSLDEIKLLRYINASGDPDEMNVVRMLDFFYHKEHLFIVFELLRDNLYEFSKYIRDCGDEPYFTLPRLQRITTQILTGLAFIHGLQLIHSDLKPENILIKSYSRCLVKIIDFGSSCFATDHLSSYVQSRSYRAPEVILGAPYTSRIDIWSLGCIIYEMWTGRVLFENDSVQTLLVRMQGVLGRFPLPLLRAGRFTDRFMTSSGGVYEPVQGGGFKVLTPRPTSLRHRLHTDDALFVDFVASLLTVDPEKRPTARQALLHPWLAHKYPE